MALFMANTVDAKGPSTPPTISSTAGRKTGPQGGRRRCNSCAAGIIFGLHVWRHGLPPSRNVAMQTCAFVVDINTSAISLGRSLAKRCCKSERVKSAG